MIPEINSAPCSGLTDGTCIHHEGEMEKNASERRRVTDLKADIKGNTASIELNKLSIHKLDNFDTFIKGIGFLITLILAGSYTYTYTCNFSHNSRIDTNSSDIKSVVRAMGDVKTDVAVTNSYIASLEKELTVTNNNLERIIRIMDNDRFIRRNPVTLHDPDIVPNGE